MGLFGKVYKGTVKNLAVSHFSSDGEIATTGCIAAYADGATFENIAIFDCNPRVYNIGNGGIVGCVGWYAKEAGLKTTFTNITVDNSNKISALWGSYDVACGGIVGQYYPTSGQTSAGTPKNAGVHFENCHVSAIMDVYNDVCGNYQYYAYRYAGMIIGSIRENTTNEDGKTIPDMTGISATGCTVNYGDWNDYYYCEFEKNGHPSYSGPDDYKFSRVPDSELNFTDSNGNGKVDADERTSVIGCKHNHTDAENNQAIYLPFHQLFTGYGWGVNSIGLEEYSGIVTNLDITEGDQEASVEKFQTKFTNDYLYRVGNQNEFTIGNLFAAIEGKKINDAGVYVRIDKQYDDSNVTCKFTANTSNWTEGTLKFEGTGVVDIVIQDYDFCKSTTLKLEVVDAVNATTATSATENNVVLLNDCSFSSLEVSGGYTLYGNGFTMTCGSDSASLSFDQFVKLESGTLDNVQIVCPNCDYAALYSSQLKDTGANRYQTTNGTTRYYNAKSAVLATGNSQILNSRISGGRAALYASNGNIVVDNSRLEGGAVATVLISAANSFVFRDATLIQKPTASTYDSNKTLMGMSVLYLCDTDGNATPTTLEGSFVQNAWADSSCTAYMPTGTSTIASTVLGKTDYTHTVNGNTCVNLGFAYMPNEGTTVSQPNNITDNRSNKEAIPYAYEGVSASVPVSGINVTINTYVYSYRNASGTNNDFTADSDYVPDKYSDIITVTYSDTAEGLTTDKSFGTDGWVYELNVDLDKLSGYSLDFSKLSMSVNGVTVTDFKVNGNAKPTSPVAVTAGGTTYTLTATVNGEEYTATYKVTGTETSKESPSKISGPTATGFGVAKSYGGDWSGAADVLTGVKIKYWSVAENKYIEYDFSNFTVPGNAGKLNGTNNYWEYTHTNNDFTLKVTNTVAIHSGKSVYGMPILGTDGKLYFTISSTNGYVGSGTTSRAITMQYEFTDNNGGEKLTFTHTFNISYDKANQYSYGDLSGSGTLTKLKDGCVTSDTLITLADGSKKRIDQLTYQDELLVWDFYNGCYTTTVPSVLFNHGNGVHKVTNLRFSDGTTVGVIDEHEFFDVDANSFVNITEENVSQYLGHRFAKATDDGYTVVTLKGYLYTEEETGKWTILTAKHFNAIANGMLSLTPDPTNKCDAFFRRYEIGENMKFDEKKMQADIEKYGLFTYADLSAYVTYEEFVAFDGGFYKTLVGKGLITVEDIVKALATYAPNH